MIGELGNKVEIARKLIAGKDQNSLHKMLEALPPAVGILLHLKIVSENGDFASSEMLQYTLLPQFNDCTDCSFLQECALVKEATQCLTTLSKFIKANDLDVTSNFTTFALTVGCYECISAAYISKKN
jgi:hypothetical protein